MTQPLLDATATPSESERPWADSEGTFFDESGSATVRRSTCPIRGLLNAADERVDGSRLAGVAMFAYGLVAYGLFFFTLLYAMGFVAGAVVPKAVDDGLVVGTMEALTVNALLLSLFVVQHTVMARDGFKRWWTRYVPTPIERSTFVIAASLCLLLIFWQWRPLPTIVWEVSTPWMRVGLHALAATGWVIVLASSFMVSHADLFGLRQVTCRLLGYRPLPIGFRIRGLYRLVRHPLMVGFIIAFWATPTMSVGHLFFAIMTTGYIVMGVAIEERDLRRHIGTPYEHYRRRVRAFLPLRRRVAADR